MKCAWSGEEFDGKGYILNTTEGPEVVSPQALFGQVVPEWHKTNELERARAAKEAAAEERKTRAAAAKAGADDPAKAAAQ